MPFPGKSPQAALTSPEVETPPPADELNSDVPPALGRLIARLLAHRPEDRPASAVVVVAEFQAIEQDRDQTGSFPPGPPPRDRRPPNPTADR